MELCHLQLIEFFLIWLFLTRRVHFSLLKTRLATSSAPLMAYVVALLRERLKPDFLIIL